MAQLRKGSAYKKTTRAYTRKSKYRRKGFIKAVPVTKIVKFCMGDLNKEFPKKVKVIAKTQFQLRHNALESCRTLVNRQLQGRFGSKGYKFTINPFPHHILRENKMLTGAGADRMQSGMKHAFGKAMGSAAQLKKGSTIFTVNCTEESIDFVKKALAKTKSRMPGKITIEIE
jgi:large subunit ribosomal protein L10e|tara:strand:- start:51 stop:566 length:516 start_codon:yes stop_codon:yes gene_type:complete